MNKTNFKKVAASRIVSWEFSDMQNGHTTGIHVMRWTIWYHLYDLKNAKNTHEGVLILVKLQAGACNFTKINTPSWVFFRFFKLHKWYQIAQHTTHMNIQASNAQFSYSIFGFDVCAHISQITPYYLKLYFAVGVFLQVPPIFQKHLFLEHLSTMASISSIEKDSIATTRDSFKNCILACKIRNEMHTNFERRKVLQAASSNLVQKWLFCKTYALHNICLLTTGLFQGKFTFTWKILMSGYLFLLQFLYIKFFEQIFLRTPVCRWSKKNQRQLKLDDRF